MQQELTVLSHQLMIRLSTVPQRSSGSSVSVVSNYGLDDRGSIPERGRGFFFYPLPGVFYPGVKRGRGVTLTTHPIQCRGLE
jgi:hypothetical protein